MKVSMGLIHYFGKVFLEPFLEIVLVSFGRVKGTIRRSLEKELALERYDKRSTAAAKQMSRFLVELPGKSR